MTLDAAAGCCVAFFQVLVIVASSQNDTDAIDAKVEVPHSLDSKESCQGVRVDKLINVARWYLPPKPVANRKATRQDARANETSETNLVLKFACRTFVAPAR